MAILNERIKGRRLSLGMTLLEVAEKLGVKEATMQRYESGAIKNIKHETIEQLAEILKTTPEYLMGWDQTTQTQQTDLPDDEKALLDYYRSLNDGEKDMLLHVFLKIDAHQEMDAKVKAKAAVLKDTEIS